MKAELTNGKTILNIILNLLNPSNNAASSYSLGNSFINLENNNILKGNPKEV
jgi:hypothetical protein